VAVNMERLAVVTPPPDQPEEDLTLMHTELGNAAERQTGESGHLRET
jgi:hypothetical protein